MRRAFSALTTLAALVAGVLLAGPAHAEPSGYHTVPWSNSYGFYHGHASGFSFYGPLGSPTLGRAPEPSYVGYPWAPSVYAVSAFDGPTTASWGWRHLTADEWRAAGMPEVRWGDAWIDGTRLVKYTTSSEIIAFLDGYSHRLTWDEWAATGARSPEQSHAGFRRLTWDPTIAHYVTDVDASPIGYAAWVAAGSPTPEALPMLPGDHICKRSGSPQLYYVGETLSYHPLTAAQWAATGHAPYRDC
ncbi:hypothetical protein [Cellulomonas endophytica]|uniref:hypothetical protein n=1 Tax=Cellulomonas endophytica TaxID=2494735 RepID=UPI0010135F6D|nr:hypothetical protein [Cellulomonas endophytica]